MGWFKYQDGNDGSVKTFREHSIKASTNVVNETDNRLLKSGKDSSSYQYSITANVDNLEPSTKYSYYIIYECVIAGMKFIYSSDDWMDFRTDSKTLWTCPDENHPHAIDLGLPSGTKWACCDVGSFSPNENGNLYAWGETEEKSTYTWKNYIYNIGKDYEPIGKDFLYIGSNISGTQYDVAHVKWGGQWRMPTVYDFIELVNHCTIDYLGGKNFIGSNGNNIWFPHSVIYWTATFFKHSDYNDYDNYAYGFSISSCKYNESSRFKGFSIRPVTE